MNSLTFWIKIIFVYILEIALLCAWPYSWGFFKQNLIIDFQFVALLVAEEIDTTEKDQLEDHVQMDAKVIQQVDVEVVKDELTTPSSPGECWCLKFLSDF